MTIPSARGYPGDHVGFIFATNQSGYPPERHKGHVVRVPDSTIQHIPAKTSQFRMLLIRRSRLCYSASDLPGQMQLLHSC